MRLLAPAILLASLAIASCGSAVRSQEGPADTYLIVASELEASKQLNLYDAVRQVRPFWYTRRVRGRSGENAISVYVDDHFIGTLSALRQISVFGAERVRYMGSTEAQTRFGQTNGGRAAILVESAVP